jgi:hypothetical protein
MECQLASRLRARHSLLEGLNLRAQEVTEWSHQVLRPKQDVSTSR